MKRTLTLLSAFIAAGLFIAAPTSADAQMAVKERGKLMKMMGGNMKKLKQASDAKTVAAAANAINVAARSLAADSLWPKGSHKGETRAKKEIWQNMKDFKSKLNGVEKIASLAALTAQRGNYGQAKNMLRQIGATCGGCHKVYRAPKKK